MHIAPHEIADIEAEKQHRQRQPDPLLAQEGKLLGEHAAGCLRPAPHAAGEHPRRDGCLIWRHDLAFSTRAGAAP